MAKVMVLFMVLIFYVSGQNSNSEIKKSPYVIYYKAIEVGADGDINKSKILFDKFLESEKRDNFNFNQDMLIQVYNDVESKKISEETAIYIFKSFNTGHNYSNYLDQIAYLNRASATKTNYEIPYILRGKIHLQLKELKKALFEFSKAIEKNSKNLSGYYFRAITNNALENYNESLADLDSAINLNEEHVDSYLVKFEIFKIKNLEKLALDNFTKARMIDSTSVRSLKYSSWLNDIGVHFKENNNYEDAIQAFSEAIYADSRWIEPFLNRGIVYRMENKFDLSLIDLKEAIKTKPDAVEGYYHRALTFNETGEIDSAIADLEYAWFLENKNSKVNYKLGTIYYEQNDIEAAIKHFMNAVQNEPNNIWANYWLGICFEKNKNFKQAIKYYSNFIAFVPESYYKHKINIQNRIKKIKSYRK